MKRKVWFIFKALFILSTLFLVSCENKEEDDEISLGIVGAWEITYIKRVEGDETLICRTKAELIEEEWYDVMVFNADGTFFNYYDEGSWEKYGNKITCYFYVSKLDGYVEDEYELNDNTLTLREYDGDGEYESSLIVRYTKK